MSTSSPRLRVFIGDVQGCSQELDELLSLLRYDPARHELWFVGDLVNRGPDSRGVLRRAIDLGANTVLGNHDLSLLAVASGGRPLRRRDTFGDALGAPDSEELLTWLRSRPLVKVWDDLILVHAGLHPAWDDPRPVAERLEHRLAAGEVPSDDPDLGFFTTVRHCDARGGRPPKDGPVGSEFEPWDAHYRGSRVVVFGHWSQRGLVRTKTVRGIDTGCVWGDRLTAWVAEEDRFLHVTARRAYAEP